MALQKREKNLLIACGVVAAGAAIYQFVIFPAQQEKDAAVTSPVKRVTNMIKPGSRTVKTVAAMPAEALQFESWGEDPFSLNRNQKSKETGRRRVEAKPVHVTPPELKGIFWKGQKAYALIDDTILAEGERSDGLHVQSIRGQEVLCYKKQRQFRLHWRQ